MLAVMIDSDLGENEQREKRRLREVKDVTQFAGTPDGSVLSFRKCPVRGMYGPYACFPCRGYVAVKPVADHDGVRSSYAEEGKGFLIDSRVGFFDAKGVRGDDRFKESGDAEKFQPQVCFCGVGVGDDGEADAGGLQVEKEVRDAGEGGDAAAFQGVIEPGGCGECGEVVLSGKVGGKDVFNHRGFVVVEEEEREVAGCVAQPCGNGRDGGEPGGYQAVEGVVEVEDDDFREGHSVGKELGGVDVIAAGFPGNERNFVTENVYQHPPATAQSFAEDQEHHAERYPRPNPVLSQNIRE